MKELFGAFLFGIFLGAIYCIGFYVGTKDKTCIGTEMQYFKTECIGKDHKVCKSDDMMFYFNLSGDDNLSETEINELAERL